MTLLLLFPVSPTDRNEKTQLNECILLVYNFNKYEKNNILFKQTYYLPHMYIHVCLFILFRIYAVFSWLKSNLAFNLITDRLIVRIITQE